jgi:hypothetical protein
MADCGIADADAWPSRERCGTPAPLKINPQRVRRTALAAMKETTSSGKPASWHIFPKGFHMTFYDGSAPVFIRTLNALSAILTKAEAHAAANNIAPSDLLEARLHPTMYPLTKQVQLACDFSGKACARFTQTELPVMADTETTFAQLQARIKKFFRISKRCRPPNTKARKSATLRFPSAPARP